MLGSSWVFRHPRGLPAAPNTAMSECERISFALEHVFLYRAKIVGRANQRMCPVFRQSPLAEAVGSFGTTRAYGAYNYLTRSVSVLYLLLFTGAGLGLLGKVGPTICLALSAAIFVAQIIVSGWWLRPYRFGPAEWLWRSLTYGTAQRM